MIRMATIGLLGTLVAAEAAPRLIVCESGGRSEVFSGPAPEPLPEPCRAVEGALFVGPSETTADLVTAIARLSARVRALEVARFGAAIGTPRLPRASDPAAAQATERLRDLGQDIDRKLDAATGTWTPQARPSR